MKRAKILFVFLTCCILMLSMVGCSSDMNIESGFDATIKGDISADSMLESGAINNNNNSETGEGVSNNRKIIEKVYYSVETKQFDKLTSDIQTEVANVGGYIETSNIDGNSANAYVNRSAKFIIRVPASQSGQFGDFVANNSNVINKEVKTEDVTLSYVDIESRLSALKNERATVERLLEKATTMSEILTITERLNEIIYEIESYQSKLNVMQNQIDFATITIRITEVEKETIIEEQTVWEEIADKFTSSLSDIGDSCVALFIWFTGNSPYLLIYGVIVAVVVFFTRRHRKKHPKARHYTVPAAPLQSKEDTNKNNK